MGASPFAELSFMLATTNISPCRLIKISDGKPAQTRTNYRRRRSLPQPSRWLPNASNARTLNLAAKYHRQRHHHAARRCHCHHVPRQGAYAGSHGALDPLARPLHRRSQEPADAESVLHHPGRVGSRDAEDVL